ncbi:MAG TPA: two-component regulator propeller domain-containing protein [Bacteroidales bacterium]|nr:two-component regulator propeller domain-containing protein [Bacteroidales bacterium]
MIKEKPLKHLLMMLSVISFAILAFPACVRHNYSLLDPDTAGKLTLYTTADGLPSNEVSDIEPDSKGNLWFSFPGNGMAKLNDVGWSFYTSGPTPLLNNSVTVLAESGSGSMLIGTTDGLSILSISNVWSSFTDPSVVTLDVSAIKVASNGWIWLGTQNKGFYVNTGSGFNRSNFFQGAAIHAIEEGDSGNIYLGTDNGIIKYNGSAYSTINLSEGLPAQKVKSLRFDSRERLWIGTDGGYRAAWIDKSGIHKLDLMTGSDSVTVTSIHEDRRGWIWFATEGNGVIRYNGILPYSYKEFNGFPENKVNCIGEDKYGDLWFGLGTKGVVKYTLPIGK